jgi:hypothetical protein
MNKPILKSFDQFLVESEGDNSMEVSEPVGLAVLGAPAGGKSYTINKISDIANDARISRTLSKGVDLTVDKLRAEFQSKDPLEQLKGFVKAFYLMKQKAQEDAEEYGKWFNDIKKLWTSKFPSLLKHMDISVEDDELYFDGKPALDNLDLIDDTDSQNLVASLDKYNDYKRVVRYFQDVKQEDAVKQTMDVSYDEAGDEPRKIVKNMDKLHKKGYVTDVFLIHPENVATNLVQNFFRVVTGGDGGRDSSDAILQAYSDIEDNKEVYQKNAEEVVKVKSKDLDKTSAPLKKANVQDDDDRGDKPIDVFIEVQPKKPEEAYKLFMEKLDNERKLILTAMLKLASKTIKGLPQEAKKSLQTITSKMSDKVAMQVLKDAASSKKYVFKYGGITDATVLKAEKAFSE